MEKDLSPISFIRATHLKSDQALAHSLAPQLLDLWLAERTRGQRSREKMMTTSIMSLDGEPKTIPLIQMGLHMQAFYYLSINLQIEEENNFKYESTLSSLLRQYFILVRQFSQLSIVLGIFLSIEAFATFFDNHDRFLGVSSWTEKVRLRRKGAPFRKESRSSAVRHKRAATSNDEGHLGTTEIYH